MKASLKFREDQKPLVRAKIPINVLGLPLLSGVSAGDSKELRFDLLTAFDSGPSFRASYRPNDASNPFTFSIKTGIGSLGSPASAPMSMTAEFNFLGGNSNPRFTVLFKPKFGDFSFKKLVGSSAAERKAVADDSDTSPVWVEMPGKGLQKIAAGGIGGLLSGMEVSARSVLPLSSKAAVTVRWGVRVPPELRAVFPQEDGGRLALGKLPLLAMSKISIEHVADNEKRKRKDGGARSAAAAVAADVAEACMSVRKQLEAIQAENGMLRKAVEELKASIPAAGAAAPQREADVSRGGKREGRQVEGFGRTAVAAGQKKEEMTEELKKALMGPATSGVVGK